LKNRHLASETAFQPVLRADVRCVRAACDPGALSCYNIGAADLPDFEINGFETESCDMLHKGFEIADAAARVWINKD